MISSDIMSDVNKVGEAMMNSAVAAVGPDPTELLNSKLASALSTLGDAQYWEETISPTTIRNELSASDPSNPNSTPVLSRGMKWLLASISKGRDVSDFYPHVVKLVGANSLEVRKMVYMYLVQYADHDATTRELSLLSINAFQRGLSDEEQLIRALALRVLSSIRINDILQIQILAVQKCASDTSPYVRKCASNALAKLTPRCDEMQKDMMLQLLKEEILDKESSTMVLTSALVAFCELCPDRLELLHTSYRKICHLLTDMDEWGQVVIVDLMARYCRRFFKEPKGLKQGAAELIDQERRVHRRLSKSGQTTTESNKSKSSGAPATNLGMDVFSSNTTTTTTDTGGFKDNVGSSSGGGGGFRDVVPIGSSSGNKGSYSDTISRPVTTKGFYSSDEESSDEEVALPRLSTAALMRQPPVDPKVSDAAAAPAPSGLENFDPDLKHLDPDHQLLLASCMPLLKSRNAGVVLAVCSLHYYCGVSSINIRSAIGKALVRIHRGRREIQYVVLTSIRAMVKDCPSAFAPFLSDFFVKTLDPPFTRLIKVDILVSLALEPAAIEAILNELRAYIRHGDKKFAKTAIRAVGRVVELARIVFDRHGASSGNVTRERQAASRIALDALHGLSLVTQVSESKAVVGEAVSVMQSILLGLCSPITLSDGSTFVLEDPNEVRAFAMRRILLLLVSSLSNLQESYTSPVEAEDSDEEEKEESELQKLSVNLNSAALSSALWVVGEWMSNAPMFGQSTWMHGTENQARAKQELLRLIDSCFPYFKTFEKEQAIHFASKVWISSAVSNPSSTDVAICEHILAMGRLDINPNVKDRARFESCLLQASIGLKYDKNGMDEQPNNASLNQEQAKAVLLSNKPSSSYLPIEDKSNIDLASFRFGTLSSLVGHQVRGTSTALPPWAKKNSPMSLREPIEVAKEQVAQNFSEQRNVTGFYDNDDSDSDSDDDSSGSSSSSESGSSSGGSDNDSDSDSDSDDESSSSSSDDDGNGNFMATAPPVMPMNGNMQTNQMFDLLGTQKSQPVPQPVSQPISQPFNATIPPTASSDDDSSESDSSDSSSSDESTDMQMTSNAVKLGQNGATMNANPVDGNLLNLMSSNGFAPVPQARTTSVSSTMDDFKGLVMNPTSGNGSQPQGIDQERDSSAWIQFVRPELCGGLSVQARYLRGPTKDNELRLRNINPSNVNAVCLQLGFRNTKPSPIRKIKVLPRSGSGGAKKTLCPPEIMELKGNQSTTAILIFQYTSMSNREGDMVGRIEIKQGYGGSVPIEVKPALGELLLPPKKAVTPADFDKALSRMQGFNRVESSYTSSRPITEIAELLKKHSSLKQVGNTADNKLRMMGLLPANDDSVLVKMDSGKITVCCDNVVSINSILSLVKRAVSA